MAAPITGLPFGVETEFILEARDARHGQAPTPQAFADHLVAFYNANIFSGQAPLRSDFTHACHPGHHPDSFESWSVTVDDDVHRSQIDDLTAKLEGCQSS